MRTCDAWLQVEKILKKRTVIGDGSHEYLVRWQGFEDDENTWETASSLFSSAESKALLQA
jgi:hypothetical protein